MKNVVEKSQLKEQDYSKKKKEAFNENRKSGKHFFYYNGCLSRLIF